jgi:hypothetical protein
MSVTTRSGEEMLLKEAGLISVPDPDELVGPDGVKNKKEDDENETSQNN